MPLATAIDGRRFRTPNIIDDDRVAMAIEVATSIPGRDLVAPLDQRVAVHGSPRAVRCGGGPERIPEALRDRAERRGGALHHGQSRKPNQSAYGERLNRADPARTGARSSTLTCSSDSPTCACSVGRRSRPTTPGGHTAVRATFRR